MFDKIKKVKRNMEDILSLKPNFKILFTIIIKKKQKPCPF